MKLNKKMVIALVVALASWAKVALGIEIKQEVLDQTINLIGVASIIVAAVSAPKKHR